APARSDVELEDLERIDLPWAVPTPAHEHLSGPQTPSVLWNAMIHPLLNMTLRGIAWYQGESNAFLHTDRYNCSFPALAADWRRAFHAGSAGQTEPLLPFGFVQLSTYRWRSRDDAFPRLRWHQTADLGTVPNPKLPATFMAVTMDLGDKHSPYGSIHPRDKQNVAYRLHLGARAVAYGEKNLVFQGPSPTRAVLEVTKGQLNVPYTQELVWRRRDAPAFE
ncbi:PREDICTED: sialate O-acetylesterase, partial [Pterocles gutturalis]|uniref:sialate O-acetylesterase n=1 Tax=Pterocles gutturalis TaxID=240206 RepID=UPI00052852EA